MTNTTSNKSVHSSRRNFLVHTKTVISKIHSRSIVYPLSLQDRSCRSRNYTDVAIVSAIRQAFRQFDTKFFNLESLCHGPSIRPSNRTNAERIAKSIESSLLASEALLVWYIRRELVEKVVHGGQVLYGAIQARQKTIWALYIDEYVHESAGGRIIDPTTDDLAFAHHYAMLFERLDAPRYELCRVIEIRSILFKMEKDKIRAGQVTLTILRHKFPKPWTAVHSMQTSLPSSTIGRTCFVASFLLRETRRLYPSASRTEKPSNSRTLSDVEQIGSRSRTIRQPTN